jgi:O-antigen biosynthesis protein
VEFTGERYVPSVDGQIKYEHLHRYALSLAVARDKSVLDIACGEGYGTALLAQVAKSAIGVDIDASTIKHARQSYYYQNIKFLVGSCESIPLPNESVEVVTSFETIEHHDKHEEMMLEIKRVLKPGGLLVISSPNRFIYSDEPNFVNSYHVKELYYDELIELLSRHFKHISCHGQRLATGSFVFPLNSTGGDHYAAYSGDASHVTATACPLPAPVYFLAVCSDMPLPEAPLNSVYLDGKDDLLKQLEAERLNHIQQLQLQVEGFNGIIAAERTASQNELTESAAKLARNQEQLAKYEEQLTQKTADLVRTSTELTFSEARLLQQSEELARERDRAAIVRGRLSDVEALLAERDEQLGAYRSQLDQLSQSLTDAHKDLAYQQLRQGHQAEELSKANFLRASAEERFHEAETNLNETQAHLIKKAEVLDWIHTSRAWRLVASMRRLERLAHKMRNRWGRERSKIFHGRIDPIENTGPPKLAIAGWVYSKAAPVTRVEAFLDDQFLGSLEYGQERPDAREFGSEGFSTNCGFAGSLPLDSPITQPRTLTIRAFDARGNKQLFMYSVTGTTATASQERELNSGTNSIEPIVLNTSNEPLLSIVIPVFNQSGYTLNCLRSITDVLEHSRLKAEVIVVDDCSTDDTQEMLDRFTGIHVISNETNSGFIDACNCGAAEARGEYLLFLNNDTLVRNGCFEELIETFRLKPEAGLVGAKLLYPDGRLQEAGGIIWNDASGWNYGRLDDPDKPEYCYLREVDYCSGACIAIPRKVFQQLGGFDTHYRPAYCEDSDLAFRVRQAGFKVYYQPLAQVVHFEGITSGRDTARSVKSHQVGNQQKFFEKWSETIANYGQPAANLYSAKERHVSKRILVLDACVLTPDQDAGSLTVFNHIRIFQSLGYKVTFAPDNLHRDEKYTANLQRIGVECLYWPHTRSIKSHLEAYGSYYDIVFVARVGVAEKHTDDVRAYCRRAKIIFDTEDLHFVREQRRAELENDEALAESALQRKEQELTVARKADCTIVVSAYERDVLLKENPRLNVSVVPIPRDMPGPQVGFFERRALLFIGGFQHAPNVDAVLYFVRTIYPLIKLRLPDIKLYIVGSKPPNEILELISDSSIIVTGYVADVAPYFNQCRLSVAPLRYGAGVKGKIITSLSYGLPVVATVVACEGIGLQDEIDVLIADEPSEFADKVVRLYTDGALWNKLSVAGFEKVNNEYCAAATSSFFERLFASLGQPAEIAVPDHKSTKVDRRVAVAGNQ